MNLHRVALRVRQSVVVRRGRALRWPDRTLCRGAL